MLGEKETCCLGVDYKYKDQSSLWLQSLFAINRLVSNTKNRQFNKQRLVSFIQASILEHQGIPLKKYNKVK